MAVLAYGVRWKAAAERFGTGIGGTYNDIKKACPFKSRRKAPPNDDSQAEKAIRKPTGAHGSHVLLSVRCWLIRASISFSLITTISPPLSLLVISISWSDFNCLIALSCSFVVFRLSGDVSYFFESRFSDGVHCSDEFSNCFLSLTVIIWW